MNGDQHILFCRAWKLWLLFLVIILPSLYSSAQEKNDDYLFPQIIRQSNEFYVPKAEALSRVGAFKEAAEVFNAGQSLNRVEYSKKINEKLNGLAYSSAKDYILAQAKSFNIVIINEAHHKPMHRAFTESLLEGLSDIGFRYLGLESLTNGWKHYDPMDTALNTRKYPLLRSGPYVPEPNYGNMVRTALQGGWYVFPYEDTAFADKTPREQHQAQQIAIFLQAHPGAKILIHCGYGHAAKCFNESFNSKLMAGFLKEYTGTDPLTIDQTILTEDSENEFALTGAYKVGKPLVFFADNKAVVNDAYIKSKREDTCYNILVYHPAMPLTNGRPVWKTMQPYKAFHLDHKALHLGYPLMVKAYYKNEDEKLAVPADIIILESATDSTSLYLKGGKYLLKITSLSGKNCSMSIEL